MKISYTTHPILKMVETKDFNSIASLISSKDKNFYINSLIKGGIDSIYSPSNSFENSLEEAKAKFLDCKLFAELPSFTSLILFNSKISILIKIEHDDKYPIVSCCVFGENVFIGYVKEMFDSTQSGKYDGRYYKPGSITDCISSESEEEKHLIYNALIKGLSFLLFVKFAQVETKILPAGYKDKGIVCNYKNETKSNIIHINCTWFTTLIKSDAFKVRGHFRLQPKKVNGQWTKELIWINDFMKEGYTAPARKLAHEHEQYG